MQPDGKETDKEYICYPCWSAKLLDWATSVTTERDILYKAIIDITDLGVQRLPVDKRWGTAFAIALEADKARAALRAAITELEQERDNLKTVLHGNQDADYDKQLQIETLKSQLAEADADADRLAKELYDWLVFAEANDQIYAARSGMNAMLHHQKRKEGK